MHSLRPWIGIALLAVCWLFGLNYYELPSTWAQAATLVLGAWMFVANERVHPHRAADERHPELQIATILLLLPVVWWTPWPYRVAPLLILAGLVLQRIPFAPRVLRPAAAGWIVSGVILLLQEVALSLYAALTARCHDMPSFVVKLLSGLCSLAGIDSAGAGPLLVMQSMRQPIRLAITWDIVFDPATMMFFVGGLTWITVDAGRTGSIRQHSTSWAASIGRFTLIVFAWLPIRAVLMVALYLHRVALTDASQPLHVANQFLSTWVSLATLIVPVLLSWRWIRLSADTPKLAQEPDKARSVPVTYLAAAACCLFGAILVAVGMNWEPAGKRKAGRVMFVERHAPWYASDRPYDTEHYGGGDEEKSVGYTYSVAYKYLSQYYEMSRLNEDETIDDKTLAGCDVLVIKIPKTRYSPDEVRAVVNFVNNGGGLLFIGDHTNWERSSAHMNDISRSFGFTFRDDVLYSDLPSPYDEHYLAPFAPHPAIQHVPAFDYLVSCSIDPGYSWGRPVVASAGLFSMNADYNYANFMPEPQHVPGARFGTFIQAWAARAGEGRVVAWGDSTIFANFCIGQPGKFPVLLNMVEWLNHQGGTGVWWLWTLLGVAAIGNGLWMVRAGGASWLVLLAAMACGWTLGITATSALMVRAMPLPTPVAERRMPLVVIDRTTSRVPLSSGFVNDDPTGGGFGILEQWIPRLNCMALRGEGDDVFKGDAIVMLYPNANINEAFRQRLKDYVERGGRLLVIDAGMHEVASTSNLILQPFGLSLDYNESWQGDIVLKDSWPGIHVDHAWDIKGGTPFASLNGERTVCAVKEFGKGLVMVVSFGTMFNDRNMAGPRPEAKVQLEDWAKDPTPEERTRFDVLFAILKRLVKDEPLVVPPARMPPAQPGTKSPSLVRPARKPPLPSKLEPPATPKASGTAPSLPGDKGPLAIPEPMEPGLEPSHGTK
jgi:hypothetical protein